MSRTYRRQKTIFNSDSSFDIFDQKTIYQMDSRIKNNRSKTKLFKQRRGESRYQSL